MARTTGVVGHNGQLPGKTISILTLNTSHHTCRIDSQGIVKVADFGLSEDVYNTGYFRQDKKEAVRLPFKWMAPESLMEGLFSQKSDVVLRQLIFHTTYVIFFPCSGPLELLVGKCSVLVRLHTQL